MGIFRESSVHSTREWEEICLWVAFNDAALSQARNIPWHCCRNKTNQVKCIHLMKEVKSIDLQPIKGSNAMISTIIDISFSFWRLCVWLGNRRQLFRWFLISKMFCSSPFVVKDIWEGLETWFLDYSIDL